MTLRNRPAVGWGIFAALLFAVLLEGYVLAGGDPPTLAVAVGATVAVGVLGTVLTAQISRRLATRRDASGRGEGPNQRP